MNSDISFAICKDCCPALPPDAPDAVKSFFLAVWRFAFDRVFIVPDLLCLFEIDAMFRFIGLAFGRIKFEWDPRTKNASFAIKSK